MKNHNTNNLILAVCLYTTIVIVWLSIDAKIDSLMEMGERGLPMAKNIDVVSAFLSGYPLEGAISTDGENLKSYGVVIARWDGDEIVMPESSIFHCITTTKHKNLVKTVARGRGIVVKEVN